jgi:hypothetical protein
MNELALLAEPTKKLLDLRATAVHDYGIHAHQLQEHHIVREASLQIAIGHSVAAVLDDDRFAVKAADIRQRLGEDVRFEASGSESDGHEGSAEGKTRDCTKKERRPESRPALHPLWVCV